MYVCILHVTQDQSLLLSPSSEARSLSPKFLPSPSTPSHSPFTLSPLQLPNPPFTFTLQSQDSVQCPQCEEVFKKSEIKIHMENMHTYEPTPDDTDCPECGDIFSACDVVSHIEDFHPDSHDDIKYPCCGNQVTPGDFAWHIADFH